MFSSAKMIELVGIIDKNSLKDMAIPTFKKILKYGLKKDKKPQPDKNVPPLTFKEQQLLQLLKKNMGIEMTEEQFRQMTDEEKLQLINL